MTPARQCLWERSSAAFFYFGKTKSKGELKMRPRIQLAAGIVAAALGGFHNLATAETVDVSAVLSPTQVIQLSFKDGSGHFVMMVQREGKSEGSGALSDASVTEYGMHDIIPGVSGDPQGYLVFKNSSGDEAYIKWKVRAVFLPQPGGKPKLEDYGFWEIAGGTGAFSGMKGVGSLQIKPAGKKERRFILKGEISQK
jgi:hypothetical protein